MTNETKQLLARVMLAMIFVGMVAVSVDLYRLFVTPQFSCVTAQGS